VVQTVSTQGATHAPKKHLRLVSDNVVHASRLLYFRGVMSARLSVQSGQFWDDSVLQRVVEVVRHSSSSWMSAAHLMTDASQGVLKIANLMQMLTTGGEPLLRKRMQMMDIARGVCRAILVDADKESFERVTTSFAGIPDLLDRFMMRVAASANMPVTVLFGRSPAGMNATGESDMRNWYDTVAAERADVLLPKLQQLVRLVMATDGGPTKGEVLDGWEITFPPLWQETAAEKATTFKTEADALAGLCTAQIVQPEEAALRLAHSGVFPELDVGSREQALKVVLERVANPPDPTELPPPLDPNAPPDPGAADA
jgi:phage-related protein (TIGR01555 family)